MVHLCQRSTVRRPVSLLALLLAGSAVFAVTTGAVEVFIDATRGAIQKIPIAVYSFKSAISVPGQFPADVLKADLRRSLLFDVAELEPIQRGHWRPGGAEVEEPALDLAPRATA